MRVVLNGQPKELPEQSTLRSLLESLSIPAERVACEVNLKIIRRAAHGETSLREGDVIELIQAIGGG
jgi:sulfur carrier protein